MKIIKKVVFLFLLASLTFSGSVFADSEEDKVIKEYEFTSENMTSLSYDVPEEIEEEGIVYILEDVRYEEISRVVPRTVEKDVILRDTSKFSKEIKEVIDGNMVTLKAGEEPKWEKKEIKAEQIIKTESRTYYAGEVIPGTLSLDGLEYVRTSVSENSDTETFSTPAYFAATDKNTKLYYFNDKLVEIVGDEPKWDGWEKDVADYLGISGTNYTLNSISWAGDFTGEEGDYRRTATVTGSRAYTYYTATFTYDSYENIKEEDRVYEYSAKVTYTEDVTPSIEAKAIATYIRKEAPKSSIIKKVATIGGGLAVVALAGSWIIHFLGKKKEDEEET